jgi:hypothetical protein
MIDCSLLLHTRLHEAGEFPDEFDITSPSSKSSVRAIPLGAQLGSSTTASASAVPHVRRTRSRGSDMSPEVRHAIARYLSMLMICSRIAISSFQIRKTLTCLFLSAYLYVYQEGIRIFSSVRRASYISFRSRPRRSHLDRPIIPVPTAVHQCHSARHADQRYHLVFVDGASRRVDEKVVFCRRQYRSDHTNCKSLTIDEVIFRWHTCRSFHNSNSTEQ